jgi:hypothetical protein
VIITDQYLKCAVEAEAKAAMHTNDMRKHWLDIACGYRNLAQARQIATTGGEISDPPLSLAVFQAPPLK